MKQILLNSKQRKIIVEDVPPPLCDENGVIVKVEYALISTGTELASLRSDGSLFKKIYRDAEFRQKAITYIREKGFRAALSKLISKGDYHPTGYSGSGVIVKIGKNVQGFSIGDRVAYAGSPHAEYVYVPKNFMVKIPEEVSTRDAAFTAVGSIALQALRRANIQIGETVLVIGLGLIGQLVTQLLNIAGCHVLGSDIQEYRLEVAKSFGLERGILASKEDLVREVMNYTGQIGVDAVIVCARSKSKVVINQAMEVCREKGRVIVVGDVKLDLRRGPFYINELDLLISRGYGPGIYDVNYRIRGIDYPIGYCRWTTNRNMKEFMRLLKDRKIDLSKLYVPEFPVEEVWKAYTILLEGKTQAFSSIIKFSPSLPSSSSKVFLYPSPTVRSKGRVNVAIIGAGQIVKNYHLPHLKKMKDVQIYAVVSRTGINAKKVAKEYGAIYCTTDYREVLEDKKIDCVLIATHHNLHKEMVIEAAKAGKHVYVEKPLAMSYQEIKEIVDIVTKSNILLTVGTNRRFSPLSKYAKNIIEKKGGPVLINYRVNTGMLPKDHWVNDPIEGGGRILGESPHFFDLMYWLIGSEPVRIYAECLSTPLRELNERNNIVSTLRFSDGSIASLLYSDLGDPKLSKERIEIFVNGTLIIINDFSEILSSEGFSKKYSKRNTGLYECLQHFIDAVKGKSKLRLTLKDGVRSTLCALKLLDSLKNHKPEEINLHEYFP